MSSKAVPDNVEVVGLGLVLLHQDEDQVSHLQTNQARVRCRLTERKTVSLVHFLRHSFVEWHWTLEMFTYVTPSSNIHL